MNLVSDDIHAYCEDHTSQVDALYERLRQETLAKTDLPQMQVGRVEGRFLKLLVQMCGAKNAIEVGTFTGYSALSIAEGLPADGTLLALDINPETAAIAQRFFDEAPWGSKITLQLGPALDSIAAQEGPFDFAFIDADKANYANYWDALVPRMRPGGLLVVDNVLWSGTVLAPETDSAKAINAFNDHAAADERVEFVMLSVRDGMLLARKK